MDAQGQRALNVITTDTGVGGIETALVAASNADIVECWEGLDEVYSPAPSTANYPTLRVAALLTFQDATGSAARLILPSPHDTIFMADNVTVDPTNAEVLAIIAAAVGHLVCGSGSVAVAFVGGQLIQTRLSALSSL